MATLAMSVPMNWPIGALKWRCANADRWPICVQVRLGQNAAFLL
jgi:hypothetical protein